MLFRLAAQALLDWLSSEIWRSFAGWSIVAIRQSRLARIEAAAIRQKIRAALERAGVEFIDENGGGPGVRLRKRQRPKK